MKTPTPHAQRAESCIDDAWRAAAPQQYAVVFALVAIAHAILALRDAFEDRH